MSMGDDYARCKECGGLFPDGEIIPPGYCSCVRCPDCDLVIPEGISYCDPCNTKAGEAADGILWAQVDMNALEKSERETSASIIEAMEGGVAK